MNHKEKLLELYSLSSSIEDINDIPPEQIEFVKIISNKVFNQKGVYTVLITLMVHKILYPEQDIRYHQSNMKNGFSGRSIDTQYITPTLKELGLPSMAESGWLTRSLEQPYPYTLDYNGRINDRAVKKSFLKLIDFIQKNPEKTTNLLRLLLNLVILIQNKNKVVIISLENPEKLSIEKIIECISEHFFYNYRMSGGAKLPVLAFYAIYKILVSELKRFSGCVLHPLGSHTASDRTSKTAGDIQVSKNDELIEVLEIKLDRIIDKTVLLNVKAKIIDFNPRRYYIFSSRDIDKSSIIELKETIQEIRNSHGCQIIINGIIPSFKYYLRLISSLEEFIKKYSELVSNDLELKREHKERWNYLLKKIF